MDSLDWEGNGAAGQRTGWTQWTNGIRTLNPQVLGSNPRGRTSSQRSSPAPSRSSSDHRVAAVCTRPAVQPARTHPRTQSRTQVSLCPPAFDGRPGEERHRPSSPFVAPHGAGEARMAESLRERFEKFDRPRRRPPRVAWRVPTGHRSPSLPRRRWDVPSTTGGMGDRARSSRPLTTGQALPRRRALASGSNT